jgi:hypothetical protein
MNRERKDINLYRDRTDEGQETPDRKYWIDKSWGEYLPTGLNIDKKKRIKNDNNKNII